MILNTASRDWIVCPSCGERHGECVDWVKSMPHREVCSCGVEMLCWSETVTTFHAQIELRLKPKIDKKKKSQKRKKKK
jgi:hypothetical protein